MPAAHDWRDAVRMLMRAQLMLLFDRFCARATPRALRHARMLQAYDARCCLMRVTLSPRFHFEPLMPILPTF